MKVKGVCGLVLWFAFSTAYAGDSALAQAQSVPAGERIANYLQAIIYTASEMVNSGNRGDIFNSKESNRFSFNYDPDNQVIDVYVVGGSDNFEAAKAMLNLTQKLIFSLNKKIQKYYGVTLGPEDLVMDYFDVKLGQKIAKYENGQYVDNTGNLAPTPTESEPFKIQNP